MMLRWQLFLRRAAAYLLDIVLCFTVLAPLGLVLQRLLGIDPQTGLEIWLASLLNFSLPVWIYFIASDRSVSGATPGKRLLGVRVASANPANGSPQSPSLSQAVFRTFFKLLPWEVVHLAAFALAGNLGEFTAVQGAGLAIGNLLTIVYLAVALATAGRRSVHDFLANTYVKKK